MRCFIGIPLPEATRAAAGDAVAAFRAMVPAGARWVAPETFHLTLKFLGPVDEPILPAVSDALQGAVEAARPFPVVLDGAGAFPSPRRPRVVWIGVGEGAVELRALAAAIDQALVPLGFEPDGRPYHPHVTVARVRRPAPAPRLPAALACQPTRCGEAWTVKNVTLFESILDPSGAHHRALDRIALGTCA